MGKEGSGGESMHTCEGVLTTSVTFSAEILSGTTVTSGTCNCFR